MHSTKDFTPLLSPQPRRPKASFFGTAGSSTILRDQFTYQTWLALGALLQSTTWLLLGTCALLPALIYISYSALETIAIALGLKQNPYMTDVHTQKFSAQFPDSTGSYGSCPSRNQVVVFLIGTRCNHPLGLLAPGFKELGDYFVSMTQLLEQHAEEYGFLGMTAWNNISERTTKSQIMSVGYFRSVEGLQAFAHGELHRAGWAWFEKHKKQYPHLGIYHETYCAGPGQWENVYVNSHAGGITSTTFKVQREDGKVEWASPVVDAERGVLKSSRGRMAGS